MVPSFDWWARSCSRESFFVLLRTLLVSELLDHYPVLLYSLHEQYSKANSLFQQLFSFQ